MGRLSEGRCPACTGETVRFTAAEVQEWLGKISGWSAVEDRYLEKSYTFPDFLSGLAFVNSVAPIAEGEGHHPDILLVWGKVTVKIFTHSIGGLQVGDFVLADKVDEVRERME